MKIILIVSLCLVGCTINAQVSEKPSGERVLLSLFDALDVQLFGEPMCNMVSTSMNNTNLRLKDHMATVLSTSYENKNTTNFSTTCNESKHELQGGSLIDIWDCTLLINETSADKEFISSSSITFSLSKSNLKFVPKSLRCF